MSGLIPFPNVAKFVLSGSLGTQDGFLPFREVIKFWNFIIPGEIMDMNPNKCPKDWGLLNSAFYIAPMGGVAIGTDRMIPPGFSFEGGVRIFHVQIYVDLSYSYS